MVLDGTGSNWVGQWLRGDLSPEMPGVLGMFHCTESRLDEGPGGASGATTAWNYMGPQVNGKSPWIYDGGLMMFNELWGVYTVYNGL
jgi:hypothetical protein